ncbi:hypothetical protein RMATCC62417_03082 [Rhizopus microsporus]|nr:hypothetical protein RMATCC62417_03082 [Rhizopus microsporus]
MSCGQDNSLSDLVQQLPLERDRKRYSKLIEMSESLQSRLDCLYSQSTIPCPRDRHLRKQYSLASFGSDITARTDDIEGAKDTSNANGTPYFYFMDDDSWPRSSIQEGHVYRKLDRATSMQFTPKSTYFDRYPSSDKVLLHVRNKSDRIRPCTIHVKPSTLRRSRQIQQPLSQEQIKTESENHGSHLCHNEKASFETLAKEDASLVDKVTNNDSCEPISSVDIELTKRKHDMTAPSVLTTKRNEPTDLPTPPSTPFGQDTSFPDLPPLRHIRKKTQSLKRLLKRTYRLNEYEVMKAHTIHASPFSDGLLIKAFNMSLGEPKLLLKLLMTSISHDTPEEQKRLGLTFCWPSVKSNVSIDSNDQAKLSIAPDSLVKEALATWLQNERLPSLNKVDEILRDGRKVYLVYDVHLF